MCLYIVLSSLQMGRDSRLHSHLLYVRLRRIPYWSGMRERTAASHEIHQPDGTNTCRSTRSRPLCFLIHSQVRRSKHETYLRWCLMSLLEVVTLTAGDHAEVRYPCQKDTASTVTWTAQSHFTQRPHFEQVCGQQQAVKRPGMSDDQKSSSVVP